MRRIRGKGKNLILFGVTGWHVHNMERKYTSFIQSATSDWNETKRE